MKNGTIRVTGAPNAAWQEAAPTPNGSRFNLFPAILFLIFLLPAACSQSPEATPTPRLIPVTPASRSAGASGGAMASSLPLVDPLALSGPIVTAGSSTVFPLSERMAERFQDEGYSGNITIDSIGSGAGFERFCVTGETDIANASRPIKESEVEACWAIGREPLPFLVGTDAVTIVVNPANDFTEDLTLDQLALIYSTAETWADVNPSWPSEPIRRFSPGTDSGTFDFFVEVVFDKEAAPLLGASNLQLSEDDNVLAQGVIGDRYAIGYFGFAFYLENQSDLKVVSIDGVEATAGNAENGTYPLARPLYLYSTRGIMTEKPQVAGFINFYLSFVYEEIEEVGYFPASAQALEQSVQTWLQANG